MQPEGFPEENRLPSRITELDPLRKITFTWMGGGDVSLELAPKGNEVLLLACKAHLA